MRACPTRCTQAGLVLVSCCVILLMGSATNSKTQRGSAITEIQDLQVALDLYQRDVGTYPTPDSGLVALLKDPGVPHWNGPYYFRSLLPRDPWEHPYRYALADGHAIVQSAGPDGSFDTDDDIDAMSKLNSGAPGCTRQRPWPAPDA